MKSAATLIVALAAGLAGCGDPCAAHLDAPGLGHLDALRRDCADTSGASTSSSTTIEHMFIVTEIEYTTTGASDTSGTTYVVEACQIVEGEAFGPCLADLTCSLGHECLATEAGTICQPYCAQCINGDHDPCLAGIAAGDAFCLEGIWCVATCGAADDDPPPAGCGFGTVCEPTIGVCVWPR